MNDLLLYESRPKNLEKISFDEYTNRFKCVKNKRVKLTAHEKEWHCRRFIPRFPSNRNGVNFWKYCKYRLIRYKPFKNIGEIFSEDTTPEQFISLWKEFLQTKKAQNQLTSWSHELENAQMVLQAPEDGADVEADPLEVS